MQGIRYAIGIAAAVSGSTATAVDYGLDPTFNGGAYFVDAFSGSAAASYRGKAIVTLANGDVVAAGVVPRRAGGGNGLGLVRYDASGARQTWANPGSFGQFGNQYVVYDPATPLPQGVEDVKDIAVFGDRLFVLAERMRYRLDNGLAVFSGHAVDLLVFGVDGAFLGSEEVINDNTTTERRAFGGGIALYGNLMFPETVSLVYGGTSVENGTRRATFRRFTVGAGGVLTAQTGVVYPNPGNYCSAPQHCDVAGIALGGRSGTNSPPRIYLGGSHYVSNWNFMVMRLDANGAPATAFAGTGVDEHGFNIANGTRHDSGRAIVVESGGLVSNNTDEIYVGGDVASNCADGVGIIKWRANGELDTSFGPGSLGIVYYGATYTQPGAQCFIGTPNRFAHGLALADGKLALVGQTNRASIVAGGEPQVDAFFSVVDATSGYDDDYAEFPYREAGQRARHSGLWGVAAAGGGFAVTGDVRYGASAGGGTAGQTQVATARFTVRPDSIFANGFQ